MPQAGAFEHAHTCIHFTPFAYSLTHSFLFCFSGALFGDASANHYYPLDSGVAQDWNGGQQQQQQQQQQYGNQGQSPYGVPGLVHQQQQHSLEQHQQQQLPPGTPGLYDQSSVASPNHGGSHNSSGNSSQLSSLPPMSSFASRPPSGPYVPSAQSVATTAGPLSMSVSPGVDIKPELTSLYPPGSVQQEAQWAMHRSAPSGYPGTDPGKLPGEVSHLHSMVSDCWCHFTSQDITPSPHYNSLAQSPFCFSLCFACSLFVLAVSVSSPHLSNLHCPQSPPQCTHHPQNRRYPLIASLTRKLCTCWLRPATPVRYYDFAQHLLPCFCFCLLSRAILCQWLTLRFYR